MHVCSCLGVNHRLFVRFRLPSDECAGLRGNRITLSTGNDHLVLIAIDFCTGIHAQRSLCAFQGTTVHCFPAIAGIDIPLIGKDLCTVGHHFKERIVVIRGILAVTEILCNSQFFVFFRCCTLPDCIQSDTMVLSFIPGNNLIAQHPTQEGIPFFAQCRKSNRRTHDVAFCQGCRVSIGKASTIGHESHENAVCRELHRINDTICAGYCPVLYGDIP